MCGLDLPLLLNSGLAGWGPQIPLASQELPGLPGVPTGTAPPQLPRSYPPPPLLTGSEQLPLGAGFALDQVADVEEMDALYSMLQKTFSGSAPLPLPPAPSTSPELQSYDHILSIILEDLGKSERRVQDLPKPHS